MMRTAAVFFALSATALGAVLAPSGTLARGAGGGARAVPARAVTAGRARSSQVTLAAAPGDLALAIVRFPAARRRASLSAHSLRAGAVGAFGDDYLAVEALAGRHGRSSVALILLVNRVTALLDPTAVSVHLRSARSLRAPAPAALANPFAGAPGVPTPDPSKAPCGLTPGAAPLAASALAPLGTRGEPLPGFVAAEAVAEAYDAVCAIADPHAAAFQQAVHPSSTCQPGAVCCPPTAICAPPPIEPPPKCVPCNPRPGYACPLQTSTDVCIAKLDPPRATAAAAGAH